MSRATPEDWLAAGLILLRDRGHDALTIDASVFSQRLLEHWEQRSTADLIAAADQKGSPAQRRAALYASVRTVEAGVERAIQAWAFGAPIAREARARIDARRIAYLAELRRATGASPKLAEQAAQIEYAAFLGAMQIFELPDSAGWKSFVKANALLLRALDAVTS